MTTQIQTTRSQILCHLTAKMTCGLKSLTLADSEVVTVECHKFESVDWHKEKLHLSSIIYVGC